MKRKRFSPLWVAAMMSVTIVMSAPRAQAAEDLLSAIPADAWAALTIRNVGEFDKKIISFSQQLNTPPMSLLAMAKGMLGLVSGVNDDGGLAVVVMPLQNIMSPQDGLAIFVPVSDFGEMTSMLQPADAGDGMTKVMLAGQEGYCAQRGAFAVLAEKPETIKLVMAADASTGLSNVWSAHQRERYQSDDVTLWINANAVFNNPMVTGMLQMFSQGQMDMAAMAAMKSISLATRLDKSGFALGMFYSMDESSPQGKAISASNATDDSLLTGLPKDDYVMAFGASMSAAEAAMAAEQFGKIANNPMLAANTDPQVLQTFASQLASVWGDLRGVSFSVSNTGGGGDGLIGFTKIVTVAGGAADKAKIVSELINSLGTIIPMPDAQKVLKAVKYSAGAESIAGASVDHLDIDLGQVEDMSEEDAAMVKKVVGSEGLMFRIATVDDTHLAVTLGGGAARLEDVIGTVKGGDAPLSADAGITKMAKQLRSKRTSEGYLSADNLMKMATRISEQFGEDAPPAMAEVNTPVAMVGGPVAAGEYQVDIAVPMEMIVAIKDMSMAAQSHGGQPDPPSGTH